MTQMSLAFSCLSSATAKSMLNFGRTVSRANTKTVQWQIFFLIAKINHLEA